MKKFVVRFGWSLEVAFDRLEDATKLFSVLSDCKEISTEYLGKGSYAVGKETTNQPTLVAMEYFDRADFVYLKRKQDEEVEQAAAAIEAAEEAELVETIT